MVSVRNRLPIYRTHLIKDSMPLSVIIVGAGIAGLATGVALREFADVTILESAAELKEVGAAFSLAPNAVQILYGWGIRPELIGAAVVENMHVRDQDGELVAEIKLPKFADVPCTAIHRADMHNELLRAATSPDRRGTPCIIHLNQKVTNVDVEQAIVTTANGQTYRGDVVIGADGIRSAVRPFVLGNTVRPLLPGGESAYRLLIPTSVAESVIPELASKIPRNSFHMVHTRSPAPFRKIVMYYCRQGAAINFVCFVPDKELHEKTSIAWTREGSLDALAKSFDSFGPFWQKMISCGTQVGLWQMHDMDPLPTWVKGRTILIGDAAHAMLTHQAQGANQAIEDAEAVAAFLRHADAGTVPEALRRTFRVRYKRASRAQALSRAANLLNGGQKGNYSMSASWDYHGAERWEKEHPDDVLTDEDVKALRLA